MTLEINKILLILVSSFLVYIFSSKFLNFGKKNLEAHQKYLNNILAIPIGGFTIILFIFFFNFYSNFVELFFLSLIFLIGLLSDYKIFNSPKKRLILQTLLIIIFLFFSDLKIISTRIDVFDNILKINYINLLFTAFCILILINGSNFIDGLNALVIGYYSLIIITLLSSDLNLLIDISILLNFLFIFLILFCFNLLNKIFLGDSGSYLLGFLFSIYLINIHLNNFTMSPYFVILLLWYPCIENLFSIIRKKVTKIKALNPDSDHFHQLLFFFIFKIFNFKKKLLANNLSSLLINLYNLLIFFIALQKYEKTNFQLTLIILNIIIYILLYYILLRYKKNFNYL